MACATGLCLWLLYAGCLFVMAPSLSFICRSPFFWGSFICTNSTCDGDRNIRKTRLPSRPVTSRTATVDYERGTRFVFCRKTLVCIGTNKRQAHDLCLLAIIAVSSVAVQIRFRCVFYVCRLCQTGIIRTRFRAADFRLNRVIRLANTVKY